jgi:hypothetical protein
MNYNKCPWLMYEPNVMLETHTWNNYVATFMMEENDNDPDGVIVVEFPANENPSGAA